VYGFPRGKNQNDFLFAQALNYRLFALLQQHSSNKPILIFVSTRKGNSGLPIKYTFDITRDIGVLSTAEQLMADYNKAVENKHGLPWSLPKRCFAFFSGECNLMNLLESRRLFKTGNSKVRRHSFPKQPPIDIFPSLLELAAAGIGAHHAGLDISDRRLVEELYLNGVLRVVVATSVGFSPFSWWVQVSYCP
jgi:ATP-dependent DNA helicase HFM1/MER3